MGILITTFSLRKKINNIENHEKILKYHLQNFLKNFSIIILCQTEKSFSNFLSFRKSKFLQNNTNFILFYVFNNHSDFLNLLKLRE